MPKLELATLAGGCFWCMEAVFRRLKGVESVTAGYAGGWKEPPTYEEVCSGMTGHAQSVQLTFDPQKISYETLLTVFFHLHDPTTLNRQGNDVGAQYRSVIFFHNDEQKAAAIAVRDDTARQKIYPDPIVTEILPYTNFFSAEKYHQEYYEKNRNQPYCRAVIDPKIKKLLKEFSKEVKDEAK